MFLFLLQNKQLNFNYLAVHIRLGDFLILRRNTTTSIFFQEISTIIKSKLIELNCSIVFIASDGTLNEITTLISILQPHHVILYNQSHDNKYDPNGQKIIIEQLICSQASYFIGTLISTFTLRIQEDRNLIGYDQSTTYNYFITQN
jgi:peptide-O-fucosyltransferase